MDVESPKHLERLRGQPEIKAALLRREPRSGSTEARFERSARNTLYWKPIEALSARFLGAGRSDEICEDHELYGRRCWLLATAIRADQAPYVIAVAAADGAPVAELLSLLRDVSDDYWHGSYFFK